MIDDAKELYEKSLKEMPGSSGNRSRKRSSVDASEAPENAGLLKMLSENDPTHVLDQIPEVTKASIMAQPENARLASLASYLNRYLHGIPNELHKTAINNETTLLKKFEKLQHYMKIHNIEFEPLRVG